MHIVLKESLFEVENPKMELRNAKSCLQWEEVW